MGIEKLNSSSVSDSVHRMEIVRIVSEIVRRSSPLAIYLFGSSLLGQPRHEGSDIDLAIIVDSVERIKPCQSAVYALPPITMGKLDLLFYSADSFKRKAQIGGVCQIIWDESELVFGKELRK